MEDKLNKGLLLTIAIPVYNTKPELLKRALLSIPDSKHIGVIVYDDGSTDYEYRTLIRDWLKNDPNFSFMNSNRFIFNRSNENKGLGAVRNTLIRKIDSDYVMFLDSDDEVMTDNFGEIIMYLLDNKVDVIYGNISLSIGDNVIEERWWDFVKTRLMIPYFTTCNFYNPKFLINHNIFYSEDRRVFEDIMFSVRLFYVTEIVHQGLRRKYIDKSIYKYNLEGCSLTRVDEDTKGRVKVLASDLEYWINEIKHFYMRIKSDSYREQLKPHLFNRVRYEVVKLTEYIMRLNGDFYTYKFLLDNLKPYKIDEILSKDI